MKLLMGMLLGGLLCAAAVIAVRAQNAANPAKPAEDHVKHYAFADKQDLAPWKITGDVALDPEKAKASKGGTLKIGPGGKAVLKFGDTDVSGKVELWVYDDGTKPADPKTPRLGPRWALGDAQGKLLSVGIIYTKYVGGDVGYTATPVSDNNWFENTIWLGVNRGPADWHKWTFNFDAQNGLQILRDNVPVDDAHFDNAKAGINGFNQLVIFGDAGKDNPQTLWISDVAVTLGAPMKAPPAGPAAVPAQVKNVRAPTPWVPTDQKVTMYTMDNIPQAPKLADLPLKDSVSEYGITWTFEKPAHVGQFVNGDWYVVGPATVVEISPKPLYGSEIPDSELDPMDKQRPVKDHLRNGFMLNPAAVQKIAFDSGVRNWWDPSLIQHLPVAMKAGDSLVSTISMPAHLTIPTEMSRNDDTRGDWDADGPGDASPTRTAAILTCVAAPLPADAFRPSYCDRTAKIYYSHNLKRDLLPKMPVVPGTPNIMLWARYAQRPWVNLGFFGFDIPVENTPWYGLEYGRVSGGCALLLCTDMKPELKEPLLVDFVQVGIDLGGVIRAGHPGWEGFGGHGSGRKLPIVFAGILLGDDPLAYINKSFPKAHFGEDEQTAYGDSWTGAKVVFTGHRGIDEATGEGRSGTGPYEQKDPKTWTGGDITSENYRRCCTSVGWVAQALALELMHAQKYWDHPAFFDYVDRWMYENEAPIVKTLKADKGLDYSTDWAYGGTSPEPWVNEMWAKFRKAPGMPPTNGWQQPHDETYYRHAMANIEK